MLSTADFAKYRFMSWLLAALGFLLGGLLAASVFATQNNAKIDLLWTLVLFVGIPIVSLGINLLLLMRPGFRASSLEWLLTKLKRWSLVNTNILDAVSQAKVDRNGKFWLIGLAQIGYMAFFFACGLVSLLILAITEVSFVWESTLFSSTTLHGILSFIASPWFFWEAAQPQMLLIECTRVPMTCPASGPGSSADWWRYVFSALLTYGLVPRFLLGAYCYYRVTYQRASYLLVIWGNVPSCVQQAVAELYGTAPASA